MFDELRQSKVSIASVLTFVLFVREALLSKMLHTSQHQKGT